MQTKLLKPEVKTQHNRPALRLVSTKNLEREEWLNIRKKGIGSSDAAAAVGLNPYKSQLELWMEKTGRNTELPQLDPNDDTSPAFWGTLLEPIVASHYVWNCRQKKAPYYGALKTSVDSTGVESGGYTGI